MGMRFEESAEFTWSELGVKMRGYPEESGRIGVETIR
jgi:hypothetical protein